MNLRQIELGCCCVLDDGVCLNGWFLLVWVCMFRFGSGVLGWVWVAGLC